MGGRRIAMWEGEAPPRQPPWPPPSPCSPRLCPAASAASPASPPALHRHPGPTGSQLCPPPADARHRSSALLSASFCSTYAAAPACPAHLFGVVDARRAPGASTASRRGMHAPSPPAWCCRCAARRGCTAAAAPSPRCRWRAGSSCARRPPAAARRPAWEGGKGGGVRRASCASRRWRAELEIPIFAVPSGRQQGQATPAPRPSSGTRRHAHLRPPAPGAPRGPSCCA